MALILLYVTAVCTVTTATLLADTGHIHEEETANWTRPKPEPIGVIANINCKIQKEQWGEGRSTFFSSDLVL